MDFVYEIFNHQENKELDFLLAAFLSLDPIIKKDLQLTRRIIEDIVKSVNSPQKMILLVQMFLSIFAKENITGPSWFHHDSDGKLAIERLFRELKFPNIVVSDLISPTSLNLDWFVQLVPVERLKLYNYEYLKLESCAKVSSQSLLEYLSLGGESFNYLLKYKQLFYYCFVILDILKKNREVNLITLDLWWARLHFLWNEILYLPIDQCSKQCIEPFKLFLDKISEQKIDKKLLSHFYVEYSGILLFYYKYKKSQVYLQMAEQLLKVKFELTGRLGMRTKFQVEKTAQLVAQMVQLEKEDLDELQKELDSLPQVSEVLQQAMGPENVQLEEESILYETPKLDQSELVEKNVKSGNLTVDEHILLLGVIEHLNKTHASDEVLKEQTQAYLNLMLDKSSNWLVFSKGLLLRSLNEFYKFKRIERALGQMQTLVDQYNDKKPPHEDRYSLYFPIHYPDYYNLCKILGQHWMKMGALQSGYQIFERLEMWDDCIECLVGQGELQRAQQEIEKFVQLGQATLKMRCILGEIKADPQILEQVWLDSKETFARAQRSLGEFHFFRTKDYEKAAQSYEKALKVNAYHANSWFIAGCAYMRLNRLDQAIKALSQCVTVDESNAEAWGNLSNCLHSKGLLSQAMTMLEQAVKYNEGNWRLWSNLMALSLRNKKFNRFYASIEKLVQLQHTEQIDEQIFLKVNQTFQFTLQTLFDTPSKRQVRFTRDRIDRLYHFLIKSIGQNHIVWEYYAQVLEQFITYEQKNYEYESSQIKPEEENKQSKVKFQDDIDEHENLSKIHLQRLADLQEAVCDSRLKACQMMMKVGWENDCNLCIMIRDQITKTLTSFKNANKDPKELNMMYQSVVQRIEKN